MSFNKAVVAGHFVISFDNVINGFLAVVMAPLYFGNSVDPIIQLLSSYAAYAALFLTGPIGSVTFGPLGDRVGRKKALLISIIGIGVPVFSIGILPTFSVIGVAAPITLIVLRLLQGIFKGAEYAGVLIHNYEVGNKRTSSSANIVALGCIGGGVAALVCWFVTRAGMPIWTWRIPFIIGGLLALTVFFLRVRISETDDFVEILSRQQISKTPMRELWRSHKLETATGLAISAMYMSFAYSSMIFGNRLFQQAGCSVSQSMLFSTIDLLWISVSIMICGRIADRIGILRQIKYGSLALIVAIFPACLLISGELTLMSIYLYMVTVTFLSALVAGCFATYVLKMFPATCRYSGFSITDSVGAVIGGATPFMMLLFSSLFGSNMGCAVWLYVIAIPTFVLICAMNRKIEKYGFAESR
ncbi:MAG: MFS transporter [Holosporales bacterium]|jgi:MHS family proline/betaine transporter-like MFS transporter|nr:MFS transporter [Holosporales bacterium]